MDHFNVSDVRKCKYILTDLGANRGDTIQDIAEMTSSPNSRREIVTLLRELVIPVPELCLISFEPNPEHWRNLDEVKSKYSKHFHKLDILHTAAGTKEGSSDFYVDRDSSDKNQVGSSLLIEKKTSSKQNAVQVQITNFIDFVQSISLNAPQAMLLAKIDIEGFEYPLLKAMLLKGVACNFHSIVVEFHPLEKFMNAIYPQNIVENLLWLYDDKDCFTKLIPSSSG